VFASWLNIWGTIVMFIADSWLTYMMTPPRDITPQTAPASIKIWHAILNHTWMPINIHRLIGNVVFGGAIVARTRATASSRPARRERAHYDWMGYVGNFIAMSALIVLPFAGYWLAARSTSTTSPWHHDDGRLHELAVGDSGLPHRGAVSRGQLLPLGRMGRIPGAERYRPYTKWLLVVSSSVPSCGGRRTR